MSTVLPAGNMEFQQMFSTNFKKHGEKQSMATPWHLQNFQTPCDWRLLLPWKPGSAEREKDLERLEAAELRDCRVHEVLSCDDGKLQRLILMGSCRQLIQVLKDPDMKFM